MAREHQTERSDCQAEWTCVMDTSLRHYCRNPRCRMKLQAPVENEHRAFCCRGCFESFYRSRCLVCEQPMRRKTEQQRFKSGHAVCRAQYRRFPHVYAWQLLPHRSRTQDARSVLRLSFNWVGPWSASDTPDFPLLAPGTTPVSYL